MSMTRNGETEFGVIVIARSGVDAGDIIYRRDVMSFENLSDAMKKELVEVAYALYESIRDACNDAAGQVEERDPAKPVVDGEKS